MKFVFYVSCAKVNYKCFAMRLEMMYAVSCMYVSCECGLHIDILLFLILFCEFS